MSDEPTAVVRDYYEALRTGDPLEAYFEEDKSTVKFGISEALFGYEEVSEALRSQTETTAEWSVESDHLVVTTHTDAATFADEVTMAWTDTESGERRRFETRWSGSLVHHPSAESSGGPEWLFNTMHVSTADTV
ncbi:SnoaL-like domain-containing protein [Natronorubrum sediminis]|uniref:SnoaL-like domain-containing protein n=1 Tax=Natronorubrum sediminis TaxID=640943 RepID=A0A1H6FYP3_9EURY|nr:AtzH-like domain-containing protein [Natronorubrum sediminis]SEH15939.1 SnoaL-like domain-containing protein [Natronorubrum sediminis]